MTMTPEQIAGTTLMPSDVREVKRGPAVVVGPYGHCLAPGHTGSVIVNHWGGHALKAKDTNP